MPHLMGLPRDFPPGMRTSPLASQRVPEPAGMMASGRRAAIPSLAGCRAAPRPADQAALLVIGPHSSRQAKSSAVHLETGRDDHHRLRNGGPRGQAFRRQAKDAQTAPLLSVIVRRAFAGPCVLGNRATTGHSDWRRSRRSEHAPPIHAGPAMALWKNDEGATSARRPERLIFGRPSCRARTMPQPDEIRFRGWARIRPGTASRDIIVPPHSFVTDCPS